MDPLSIPFGPVHPDDNTPDSSVFEVPDGSGYEPPDAATLAELDRLLGGDQ